MTRTKVGLAAALLLLVTACTTTEQDAQPSTTPILPPNTLAAASNSAQATSGEIPMSDSPISSTPTVTTAESLSPSPDGPPTASESSSSRPAPPSTSAVGGAFDPSIGSGLFTLSIPENIVGPDRELAEKSLAITRDSMILSDAINRNPSDLSLDAYLEDYYFGYVLEERLTSVQQIRAAGRVQTGWMGADLDVIEVSGGTVRIEGCIRTGSVSLADAAGQPIPLVYNSVFMLAGVTTYEPGLRIGHLETRAPDGTKCAA